MCMYFFFFQAEDGIRDGRVTGVQTCALPIWGVRRARRSWGEELPEIAQQLTSEARELFLGVRYEIPRIVVERCSDTFVRSEERRVGKECRSRLWPCH